jgi:hypothetical protein
MGMIANAQFVLTFKVRFGMVKNNNHTNISSNEPLTDIQHK